MDSQLISSRGTAQSWNDLVKKGISRTAEGLSQFIGRDVSLSSTMLKQVALEDVPDILGSSETLVVAIDTSFSGSASGSLMLVYCPELVFTLADMAADNSPGTTQSLNDAGLSFLNEIGKIMSSSFLSVIEDLLKLTLQSSPSKIIVDMNGAVLDIAMLEILDFNEDILVSKVSLNYCKQVIQSTFIIIPSPGLLELARVGTGGRESQ